MASIFLTILFALSPAAAGRPKKSRAAQIGPRVVWAGLVAGPLSPKDTRELELDIVRQLHEERGLTIVDVGGRPMGPTAEKRAEDEHQERYNAGVRALLHQDYERALRELDQAAELFDQTLAGLRDHRLRYGTLIAKAAVLLETGRKEAARAVLRELAALEPGAAAPTKQTQSEDLVQLYEEALRSMSAPVLVRLEGATEDMRIRLDGRDLGKPPFSPVKLRPGKHLLSVRTESAQRIMPLQIGLGDVRTVRLLEETPEDRVRSSFLDDVAFRPTRIARSAEKLSKLSRTKAVLVAWARKEKGEVSLYLSRLSAEGKAECVGRAPSLEALKKSLAPLVLGVLDLERSGGFEVQTGGKLESRERLAGAIGERATR